MMLRIFRFLAPCLVALTLAASASAAPAQPDADDLIAGARLLDGRALSLEARARARIEHAERDAARAKDLKQDAARSAERGPSLAARADELDAGGVKLRAEAARDRDAAKRLRSRATELRARAKQVARLVAQAPPTKKGRLDVSAAGTCDLEIDGVPRGHAPMLAIPLAEGGHVVTCTAEGRTVRTRTIEVRVGQVVRVSFDDLPSTRPVEPF